MKSNAVIERALVGIGISMSLERIIRMNVGLNVITADAMLLIHSWLKTMISRLIEFLLRAGLYATWMVVLLYAASNVFNLFF